MKKIVVTVCFCLVLIGVQAQSKMERDLKIFQTMLEDFLNKEESNVFSRKSVSVKYYEGFGVVVKIPLSTTSWRHRDYLFVDDFGISKDRILLSPHIKIRELAPIELEKNLVIIQENESGKKHKSKSKNKALKSHEKAIKKHHKALESHERALEEHEKALEEYNRKAEELHKQHRFYQEEMLKKQDSLLTTERKESEEKIKSFLVEYADLLTELKAHEKIRVLYSQNPYKILSITWDEQEQELSTTKFSDNPEIYTGLEVLKSDIDDFKLGKISEKIFVEKIKPLTQQKNANKTHFEVLADVLDKLVENIQYKKKVKKIGKTKMFYLENFGIEYDTKMIRDYNFVYSQTYQLEINNKKIEINLEPEDSFNTTKKFENEKQNENNELKNQLAEFEKEIEQKGKEYLLLYGKTLLPFLKNNEKITWIVSLDSPKIFANKNQEKSKKAEFQSKKMIFTVTRQVLEQYDNKQMTLEQALKEVIFEKLNI